MPNEPKITKTNPPTEKSNVSASARHNARHYAIQAMYQWQVASTPLMELEAEFITYQIDKKIDLDYFKELLHGIPQNIDVLDAEITPFLGRQLTEIDPIELAVLRLAVYEMSFCGGTPPVVIINEAISIAKKYGTEESGRFVNGVLGCQ